ncbi:MAG: hypothetical protein M1833_007120 [Piccolia ochrophora]|nr:MAG: hypothetical protein M1833_007120 [Piccolia ochrophora]
MDVPAKPPIVPDRGSAPQDRRRSLPSPSLRPGRLPNNRVHVKPANPEVISSLISSLSTISPAAASHFENLTPSIGQSKSSPSSPSALQSTFERLHPDDAATPPVVRTSKSPSALSPLNPGADGWSHSKHPLRGPGSPRWKDQEDSHSIGSVSIEPGDTRRNSITSRDSTHSDNKRSWRGHMGLKYMSSKERLREKEGERHRSSGGAEGLGLDILDLRGSGMPSGSSTPAFAETAISGESYYSRRPSLPVTSSSVNNSPSIGGASPVLGRDSSPGPVVGGRLIPSRESSLRRTSNGHANPKRRSYRSSVHEIVPASIERTPESEQPARSRSDGQQNDVLTRVEQILTNGTPGQTPTKSARSGTEPPISMTTNATSQIEQSIWVHENVVEDDESAPSPSIVQRKPRENNSRVTSHSSLSPAPRKVSPSSKGSGDQQLESSPLPQRRNSRLQKRSRPSSPKSTDRHHRTFSNPLHRKSEAYAAVRAPKIVVEDRASTADSIEDSIVAYLGAPRLSQKVKHPQTGRVISFSEVGDPEGFAVFCCVGMGLTRYIMAFYDELALSLKLRLITPDRPGVGESEPYSDGTGTPLGWPDDVYAICQSLKITKFSILAHSAGAIYALATALRMPQHIRGRIHLLAPWIPASQLSALGAQQDAPRGGSVPTSQKILRALPTPLLKAANSSFMSATSSKITSSLPKSPRRKRKSLIARDRPVSAGKDILELGDQRDSLMYPRPNGSAESPLGDSATEFDKSFAVAVKAEASLIAEKERRSTYDDMLTRAIWDLATSGANPAVDLLVCLERRHTIGFRYVDITRSVVIHHGSRDTRVPVENVRWLGKTMRRCEVRVLEGEGHGLMASAGVMGNLLVEIASEWEDWMKVVQRGRGSSPRVGS